MKLLEYQAKEVLASLGIAIPPGEVARTPAEPTTKLYRAVPDSDAAIVRAGGRGRV